MTIAANKILSKARASKLVGDETCVWSDGDLMAYDFEQISKRLREAGDGIYADAMADAAAIMRGDDEE